MTWFKLFRKSLVFSTRSKRRLLTFIVIFTILGGATILLVNRIDSYSNESLLYQKGVYLETTHNSVSTSEATSLITNIGETDIIEEVIIFEQFIYADTIRVIAIDHTQPWTFDRVKPNSLEKGRFPQPGEILVSANLSVPAAFAQPGLTLTSDVILGNHIRFNTSSTVGTTLEVVGIFPSISGETFEWILVPNSDFDDIKGQNIESIYAITLLAKGNVVLEGSTYEKVDTIANSAATAIAATGGDWETPGYSRSMDKIENKNLSLYSLIIGSIGTLIVATLYSYLIVRFRKREIAILKAVGYSKWHVRTVLLAEILLVSMTGFVLGLLAIQASILLPSSTSYAHWILFSPTSLFSFFFMVVFDVPGFFIISTKILGVRPIEVFRQK